MGDNGEVELTVLSASGAKKTPSITPHAKEERRRAAREKQANDALRELLTYMLFVLCIYVYCIYNRVPVH
jgi:hypothetical protein